MICPKCKKNLKDNAKFCGYCGKKFNVAPTVVESTPKVETPVATPTVTYEANAARCRYCGSTSLQAVKQGASVGKVATGAILFGVVGAAVGASGMNKDKIICLNCRREQ